MYDIFISHSSADKIDFVNNLVDYCQKNNISVWYDINNIKYSNNLKLSIKSGVNHSMIFVVVLSKNYLNSNWASLELGILENRKDDIYILPIVYPDIRHQISELYPFLLERKYIIKTDNFIETADQVVEAVKMIRNETGYIKIEKTDLKNLSKKLRDYNKFKLDKLSIYINHVVNTIDLDFLSSINYIKLILDTVLIDIAEQENIYIENDNLLEKFLKSGFFNLNIEEHFKFLNKQYYNVIRNFNGYHTLNINKDDIYLIELSLYSIIEWYILSYFKQPIFNVKKLIAVYPENITHNDICEMHNIEEYSLPTELIASVDITELWYNYNPLTIIGARDVETNKLVGFIHALPVSDEYFNIILSGNFDDTNIDINHLRQYDIPGFYKLYLSSFCINPQYNTTMAFKIIYSTFIEFLISLAEEREIFISHIIADGATPKGSSLCESIGMEKYANTTHDTTIYTSTLIPPSLATIKLNDHIGKKLINFYKKIYDRYMDCF